MAEPDVSDSSSRTSSTPQQTAESACGPAPDAPRKLRGVITDWGGVLTHPLTETVYAWLEADGIDRDSYRTVMRAWVAQAYDAEHNTNPIRALERGECTEAEFEQLLAAELIRVDGGAVPAGGLLARMFAASAFDEAMHELIRAARRAGLRTALLSNSWGDNGYPRHLFPELFDTVVISSEVGMRKPEERIFRLAIERLGLQPAECVFIDDIQENVNAARAAGLVSVWHQTAADTTAQLAELLGISL